MELILASKGGSSGSARRTRSSAEVATVRKEGKKWVSLSGVSSGRKQQRLGRQAHR